MKACIKKLSSNAVFFLTKISLALFILQSSIFNLHSQTPLRSADLNVQEPSWQAVIGGVAVSPCIETSYGVALLSDGRLLSACTGSGTVIWQRSIKGRPSPYITAFGDFLYVVTDSSKINLVNPSGMTLWTANTQFPIVSAPVVGRDGRVFVQGKNKIACYGLDGKRKWKKETPELGNLPLCLLDDSTLLAFLKAPKGNQSIARRYSVFGKQLEDITFSGIVSSAVSFEKGVLVALKNGSIGLVTSSEDGSMAKSKWVQGSGNTSGAFKICCSRSSGNAVFFFQNGSRTEAVIVDRESGEIINRFQVGSIAPADFKLARATPSGFFISGSYSACEFGEDGSIFFAASLPPAAKWNSLFYTDKNFIILAMKDWTMKGFLMNQVPKPDKFPKKAKSSISYISSVEFDSTSIELGIRPLTNEKMAEISRKFESGDYGEKEEEYLELLKTEAQNYIHSCSTKAQFRDESISFFAQNAVYTQNLLYLMSKTGTREFSLFYARLLSGEIDSSQLLSIISFAGKNGYDEDGMVLAAIENILMNRIKAGEVTLLKTICDTTFGICRYMGRPALNKRGKNILTHMLFPGYDKSIQDYARKTLEKMITLEKK